MEDLDAQKDEILALQSIFDENQIVVNSTENQFSGCMYIKPELCNKFTIYALKYEDLQQFAIEHLCPLEMHFSLPSNYPSVHPPKFTLVCKWLTRHQLSKLCGILDQKWEENMGEVVLFDWIQYLQYEALKYLGITEKMDLSWMYGPSHDSSWVSDLSESPNKTGPSFKLDSRAVRDQLQVDMLEFLKDYDKQENQTVFDKSCQSCKVCFSEKLGSQCIQFPNCCHIYCKECMKSYFEIQIMDGVVKGLSCPEDKCTSQASPAQVKELVSPDLFTRYDSLLLESTIASMLNLTYCPRPKCQYPLSFESDSSMGSCPLCNFHFCLLCKASFHGVAPCKISSEEMLKMYEVYMNGTDCEKENLEKRFGKSQMLSIINDIQNAAWMETHSKKCPHCNSPIEKKDGCNKMTCPRCSTYFCWLCLAQLDRRFPYLHFSSPTSKCNLFEGLVDGDNDSDEEDFL